MEVKEENIYGAWLVDSLYRTEMPRMHAGRPSRCCRELLSRKQRKHHDLKLTDVESNRAYWAVLHTAHIFVTIINPTRHL
jgi:hypothetical protein